MELVHRETAGRLPTSTFDLVREGAVIGFTQIRHRPSHSRELAPEAANHIYYEVAEPHRGQGYGRALLTLALQEAKRLGLSSVRLTCTTENIASQRVIGGCGANLLKAVMSSDGTKFLLFEVNL